MRLWWLFPVAAVLIAAFVVWERRVVRARDAGGRGGDPLLDIRLLTGTAGFASGVSLGTVYFVGFSGIWLVFALYFQTGLGYTPLQSRLAVTPFALGSASSAILGGRLVDRYGRLVTVAGLSLVVAGLGATALVLLLVPPGPAGIAATAPLLVAGVGGGWVISPNTTMTLRRVPVRMAGSAGGALQTGQRIGAAIGTALLAGVYYAVLAGTGRNFPVAVSVAVAGATAAVFLALLLGVAEWRRGRRRASGVGAPDAAAPDRRHLPDPH